MSEKKVSSVISRGAKIPFQKKKDQNKKVKSAHNIIICDDHIIGLKSSEYKTLLESTWAGHVFSLGTHSEEMEYWVQDCLLLAC